MRPQSLRLTVGNLGQRYDSYSRLYMFPPRPGCATGGSFVPKGPTILLLPPFLPGSPAKSLRIDDGSKSCLLCAWQLGSMVGVFGHFEF